MLLRVSWHEGYEDDIHNNKFEFLEFGQLFNSELWNCIGEDTDVLSHIYHLGIGEQFDYCDPSGRVRFIKLNNDFWESQINERFEPKETKYKRG
jgi:hypothetical protein